MQTDATSHNIVACSWGFLANIVASVRMGLKVEFKPGVKRSFFNVTVVASHN